MNRIRSAYGYLICALLVYLPVQVAVGTLFGISRASAVFALILTFAGVGTTMIRGAHWLRGFHRAKPAPAGMSASLDRALFERGIDRSKLPVVWIFPDPAPNALVMRSLLGTGAILLSQGLTDRLTEAELRSVLVASVHRVRDPLLSVRTLGAALAALVLRRAPESWKEALITTRNGENPSRPPMAVLPFLTFSFLLGMAESFQKSAPIFTDLSAVDPDLVAARHKMEKSARHWGLLWVPGAARLYLFPPHANPQTDLMSLSSA